MYSKGDLHSDSTECFTFLSETPVWRQCTYSVWSKVPLRQVISLCSLLENAFRAAMQVQLPSLWMGKPLHFPKLCNKLTIKFPFLISPIKSDKMFRLDQPMRMCNPKHVSEDTDFFYGSFIEKQRTILPYCMLHFILFIRNISVCLCTPKVFGLKNDHINTFYQATWTSKDIPCSSTRVEWTL